MIQKEKRNNIITTNTNKQITNKFSVISFKITLHAQQNVSELDTELHWYFKGLSNESRIVLD